MTNAFTTGHVVTAAEYDADVSRLGTWASGTFNTGGGINSTGTSFAAGTDVLASPLSFTADGTSNYLLRVYASAWYNSAGGSTSSILAVNLDGNNRGIIAQTAATSTSYGVLSAVGFIPAAAVSAGSHTINARLYVSAASNATIVAAAGGGSGTSCPCLVAVAVL